MTDKMIKIILTEKDYRFINFFCKKHYIREGSGDVLRMQVILNEYKKWSKLK